MYEEFIPEEKGGRFLARELFDWIESAIAAVLCAFLVFTFGVRQVGVVGESMAPNLAPNDRLAITRCYNALRRGDIVVITKPNSRNEPLIKRVIATGGQTIEIDRETGQVYVDGRVISERYIQYPIRPGAVYSVEFPQVVPYGSLFVMGDNRNNSLDSRFKEVGIIDERHVLGKVIYRIWPHESIGRPT